MLTPEQKVKYEQIRQTALADLVEIDRQIEAELAAAKKRLLELQEGKKAVKQILDGAAARLGISATAAAAAAPSPKEFSLAELDRDSELAKA